MTRKRLKAPLCLHCPDDVEAALVGGAVIYPRRADLHDKPFWRCPDCGAYCGCHPGTKKALGRPANRELRDARSTLHQRRFDPLWVTAIETGDYSPEDPKARKIITNTARKRCYDFLSDRLGIARDDCHIAMFDLQTCRRAWAALSDITYPHIREWSKARKAAAAHQPEATNHERQLPSDL